MVTRMEIAKRYKYHAPILKWKIDEHAQGIFFDANYGYLIERTYAVRMKHDEDKGPAFYVPTFEPYEDDEVYISYPYRGLRKHPNKHHFLFRGMTLKEDDIPGLFYTEESDQVINIHPSVITKLLIIPTKKRIRDRMQCLFYAMNDKITIVLVQKKQGEYEEVGKKNYTLPFPVKGEEVRFSVNANDLLHALNLFLSQEAISFSVSRDKIKITSEESQSKVEVIISRFKEEIVI